MRKQALAILAATSVVVLAGCSSEINDLSLEANETPSNTLSASAQPTASETEPAEVNLDEPLTDLELVLMALMGPDGEFAAAASYQAVLDEFGQVEPYATILNAETRHADALVRQLERLGEEVPENPYIGQIPAPTDLQSAAEAWAEGEVANVELYDFLIAQTDDPQLIKVFENLRAASADSHLPAFEAAAENGGTLDDMTGFGHGGDASGAGHNNQASGHSGQGRQHGKNA